MEGKKINNNEHPYVDLGLPSGTLWATCNVGASKPSDYGLYFQWGDTQGYTKEQVGKDKQFNWRNYKWSIDGSNTNFSKYTSKGATLELEDDAAHVNMGGSWHIPSLEQISELINGTISEWATLDDGVKGMKFASKKDKSKYIFIPAAGSALDGLVVGSGYYGYVWSSMLYSNYHLYLVPSLAFDFISPFFGDIYFRDNGFTVRAVIG